MDRMKIVAIGLSHNEGDVIRECVTEALSWVDAFVLYDSSTDGTADIARVAGAVVLPGDPGEAFNEGLRQHALVYASRLSPDWIVRIDPDEFYPDGARFEKEAPQNPREILWRIDRAGYLATRAHVVQFWITLDDIRRGLLLEDENTSIQKRRRWYTVGHTAVVAWKHRPNLTYVMDQVKNVPLLPDSRDVGREFCSAPSLIQTHYTCRSWCQLARRVEHRRQYRRSFGKYAENLVIDEAIGLHYWDGGAFNPRVNHRVLYEWFEKSRNLFAERGL